MDNSCGKIYTLYGKFNYTSETYEGKPIFRKMSNNRNEFTICKLLMENPHENIISIYKYVEPNIYDRKSYIDMELLNTNLDGINFSEICETMRNVQSHLHKLGIMYIDWKPDNIGIDKNGKLKLFDFDVSGLIDLDSEKWIIEPPKCFFYNNAIKEGKQTPIDIDNYTFKIGLM